MIRWAVPSDHDALGQVMFEAIHQGPSPYTPSQKAAWLPAPNTGAAWSARLAAQSVAVLDDQGPQGFMSLREDGYIDLAYLRLHMRGKGRFRALFARIEAMARAQGLPALWTHASLMAQGAFGAVGFSVVRHETVERAGETLLRAEMRIDLDGQAKARPVPN